MDDYLKQYREMISLRGLTDHTLTAYSTYISAYLGYLSDILGKSPEEVSWAELRDFIRWLQKERQLSDRTVNACISQLRFLPLMSCAGPGIRTSFHSGSLIPICLLFPPGRKCRPSFLQLQTRNSKHFSA